jgi:hypothetical protein
MVGEGRCSDFYRDLFRPTGDFSHKLSIIVKEPGSRGEGIEKLFRQRLFILEKLQCHLALEHGAIAFFYSS